VCRPVCHVSRWRRKLLEKTELPHDTMRRVVLHVHVVHQLLLRQPIRLVPETQGAEVRRTSDCSLLSVGLPDDVPLVKGVELLDESCVASPNVRVSPVRLHERRREMLDIYLTRVREIGNT
jgi:hypothetical protein